MIVVLDIIGFITGVAGAIMVGRHNRYGFLLFVLSSASHGSMGGLTGRYGLMAMAAVFIVIDIYYFRKWKANE